MPCVSCLGVNTLNDTHWGVKRTIFMLRKSSWCEQDLSLFLFLIFIFYWIFLQVELGSEVLTGLVMKDLLTQETVLYKFANQSYEVEDDYSLLLPEAVQTDCGRYRCTLWPPVGHYIQDGDYEYYPLGNFYLSSVPHFTKLLSLLSFERSLVQLNTSVPNVCSWTKDKHSSILGLGDIWFDAEGDIIIQLSFYSQGTLSVSIRTSHQIIQIKLSMLPVKSSASFRWFLCNRLVTEILVDKKIGGFIIIFTVFTLITHQ